MQKSDDLIGTELLCRNGQTLTLTEGDELYPVALIDKTGELVDYVFSYTVSHIVEGARLYVGDPVIDTQILKVIRPEG